MTRPRNATRHQGVHGRVLDSATDAPIVDAVIFTLDRGGAPTFRPRTSADGHFGVVIPASGRLYARRLGFHPFLSPPLDGGADASLAYDVRLAASAMPPEATIIAEQNGIRQRQVFGIGDGAIRGTIFTPSHRGAAGKDAVDCMDLLRRLRPAAFVLTPTCVQSMDGRCYTP